MSLQTYHKTQTTTETPRQTEYRAFALVTRRMLDVSRLGEAAERAALRLALDQNRRLWNTLLMDCAREENQLADPARAGIISLAVWVEKHSRLVLGGHANLEPLIEVNRTVMDGLAV